MRRQSERRENFLKKQWPFSKFDKNDKSISPRSSKNFKHKKHKATPKYIIIKVLKTSVRSS